MSLPQAFFRLSELDRTTWPEVRDQILQFEHDAPLGEPRSYPGYPRWPLDPVKPRLSPPLERVLLARRSHRQLSRALPPRKALSRLLRFSHGAFADGARGPVPSAGGLQALELYLAVFEADWLPAGMYHYDRLNHTLAQLGTEAPRPLWERMAPALSMVAGGSLLWVVVGDAPRVEKKYGARGLRFLLLEAGHLMQNLCLMSARLGLATLPLGGFLESEVARTLTLPATDLVLYLGVCGRAGCEAAA